MISIRTFNGGIGRAVSKYTLPMNYGVDVTNCDIEFGYIQGIASPVQIQACPSYFYIFQGQLFSNEQKTEYVELGNKLFIKEENKSLEVVYQSFDEQGGNKKLERYDAGIDNNEEALYYFQVVDFPKAIIKQIEGTVLPHTVGMKAGEYTYRVAFLFSSKIVSYSEAKITLAQGDNGVIVTVERYETMEDDSADSSYRAYIYRESGGKFYLRHIADVYDTISFIDSENSIEAYPLMPEVASSTDTAKVQYQFTYYNEEFDIESEYSPLSDVLEVPIDRAIWIGQIPYERKNPFVSHINIYRLGTEAGRPILVKRLPNKTNEVFASCIDILVTTNAYSLLDTSVSRYRCNPKLQHLCSYNHTIFGAVGERVYHSVPGSPEYWGEQYSFLLDGECTALLPCKEGVLAFTLTRTYLISFLDNQIMQFVISNDAGCNSHESCNSALGIPIFSNEAGFYLYNNFMVVKLSHALLGNLKNLRVTSSCVANGHYYACTEEGFIYAIDMTKDVPVIRTLYPGYNFVKVQAYSDNTIYGTSTDGYLYSLFSNGEDKREAFEYMTGMITLQDPNLVYYFDKIVVIGDGRVEMTIVDNSDFSSLGRSYVLDFSSTNKRGDIRSVQPVIEIPINEVGYGVQLKFKALYDYSRIHMVSVGGTPKV